MSTDEVPDGTGDVADKTNQTKGGWLRLSGVIGTGEGDGRSGIDRTKLYTRSDQMA